MGMQTIVFSVLGCKEIICVVRYVIAAQDPILKKYTHDLIHQASICPFGTFVAFDWQHAVDRVLIHFDNMSISLLLTTIFLFLFFGFLSSSRSTSTTIPMGEVELSNKCSPHSFRT